MRLQFVSKGFEKKRRWGWALYNKNNNIKKRKENEATKITNASFSFFTIFNTLIIIL
jgi:hypothetical protein